MSYWLCARPRRVLKSLSRELHMEHWCWGVRSRGGETEGRKMKGEKGRQNEEAFSLAFLPLSLSSPMSKTDGAGVLCVFAYRGTCKCRLMWPTQLYTQTRTVAHTHAEPHTPLSPALVSASSGASQGSNQTSAICSQSALRVGRLISSQLTPSTKFSVSAFICSCNIKRSFLMKDHF